MSCSTKSAWDGKIIEREEFSNYRPVPPLRRSFQITVGIIALVLRTVKKIEKLLIKKRIKEGKASIGKLQSLNFPPPQVHLIQCVLEETSQGDRTWPPDQNVWGRGIPYQVWKEGHADWQRTQLPPEHIFKKTTKEVLNLNVNKFVEKIGVMRQDNVLQILIIGKLECMSSGRSGYWT